MNARDPEQLLNHYVDMVFDVAISDDAKTEIVINLAKAAGLDDQPLKRVLQRRFDQAAADHPYFHWKPQPRFPLGEWVRIVDGAPQALGRRGRVTQIENPRRLGVRGMAREFFYTVTFEDAPDPWGFREEQLEQTEPPSAR